MQIILQRNSWFEAGTHSIAKKKILSSRLWSQLSNFELICLLINCMRQSESFSTVYRVLRQVQHLSTSSTIMASSTFKCTYFILKEQDCILEKLEYFNN